MVHEETHLNIEKTRDLIVEKKAEIKRRFKAEVIGIFGSYARGEESAQHSKGILRAGQNTHTR